jgi:hypothetical protein
MVKETLDRVRHIEIQLTRFLENGGFDTGAEKPSWNEGVVTIPSLDCSLRGILAVIPGGEERERASLNCGEYSESSYHIRLLRCAK